MKLGGKSGQCVGKEGKGVGFDKKTHYMHVCNSQAIRK